MALPRNGREPLEGHHRYTKVKDLNKGSYGFVQLAHDRLTAEQVKLVPTLG
jgi:serine/threonine-protein kinase SRK2